MSGIAAISSTATATIVSNLPTLSSTVTAMIVLSASHDCLKHHYYIDYTDSPVSHAALIAVRCHGRIPAFEMPGSQKDEQLIVCMS